MQGPWGGREASVTNGQLHGPLLPRYSSLDLQSQEAYEMAVQGVIRPMSKSPMLVTGIRCLHFAPPEFLLGKFPRKLEHLEGAPGAGESPCRALAGPAVLCHTRTAHTSPDGC